MRTLLSQGNRFKHVERRNVQVLSEAGMGWQVGDRGHIRWRCKVGGGCGLWLTLISFACSLTHYLLLFWFFSMKEESNSATSSLTVSQELTSDEWQPPRSTVFTLQSMTTSYNSRVVYTCMYRPLVVVEISAISLSKVMIDGNLAWGLSHSWSCTTCERGRRKRKGNWS